MPAPIAIKKSRHEAILRLIDEEVIDSQESIAERLSDLGYSVTQSSVSRDLRELSIAKVGGAYRALSLATAKVGIIELTPAGPHMVVARTLPGTANAVAIQIDRDMMPGIAGTVAGDDTIFIALSALDTDGEIWKYLESLHA